MENSKLFSILVNSTDSFEDCWHPFFKLFKKFWPQYNGNIYLNCETKLFIFDGLNIISIQNNNHKFSKKISWSSCLLRAIKKIPENIILYLQEDYFINAPVKDEIINNYAKLIIENPIDCIHLSNHATIGPFLRSDFNNLLLIDPCSDYRISAQAALWKKDILASYLRSRENAWQFEKFGSLRSKFINHKFYNINPQIFNQESNPIIPYFPTGIIKGKWNKPAVYELFKQNDIKIDFNLRGWHAETKISEINKIWRKLRQLKSLISYFELIKFNLYKIFNINQ